MSDLFDDMDLEETYHNDTGFEQDVDVEIIDGFYHQNMLYSNCCLQRDHVIRLLNDWKPEGVKAVLCDWPDTTGSLNVLQLLFKAPLEKKRNKQSTYSIECDGVLLINEMKKNYIRGERVHLDVPNVLPEGGMSLTEYLYSAVK